MEGFLKLDLWNAVDLTSSLFLSCFLLNIDLYVYVAL